MKKRLGLCAICCLVHLCGTAQFYDRAWLVGWYGDIKLTYLNNTPDTSIFFTDAAQVIFTANGSDVSDTNGNILFLTNGARVGNPTGLQMDNGDGLLDSLITVDYPYGIATPNCNIILPKSNNQFYLLNISESDSLYQITGSNVLLNRLYYSVIDMSANAGLGKVISKKNILWNQGLIEVTRLTACRHANGRDWWVIGHEFQTNGYYIFLVTPDTVYPPVIQHLGPTAVYGAYGQSVFSPDGTLFASCLLSSPVVILGFDRCSGIFTYIDTLELPIDSIYSQGHFQAACDGNSGIGCSFSPSGRFLYVSSQCYLMQYDMQADTISNSGVLVARVDTTETPPPLFKNSLLSPNNQIVMCSWDDGPHNFHLVQYPDLKAPNCGFQYYGLATNSISATSLPNMVNYRLGALVGSGCDTLSTGINTLSATTCTVKVYPNPASGRIIIGLTTYLKDAQLCIYDARGAVVYQNPIYLDADVDVSGYASGVYLVRVSSKDGNVSGKFVKD